MVKPGVEPLLELLPHRPAEEPRKLPGPRLGGARENLDHLPALDKMMLLERAKTVDWVHLSYTDVQRAIQHSPPASLPALHTPRWRTVFIALCDDSTIADAVTDLRLRPALAADWIREEQSWP